MPAWLAGLGLFLLTAFSPGRALAALPNVSEPRIEAAGLPQLPSALSALEQRETERAECGAFCSEPLKLGLRVSLGGSETPSLSTQDAWGNYRFPTELQASSNRFGFTGYLWDQESKLFFAKARFYDPEVGRFTSQDSFLGVIENPPSLHRYFYGNGNPTRYVDPTGHEAVPAGPTISPEEVAASVKRDLAAATAKREAAAREKATHVIVKEDHGIFGNPIDAATKWLSSTWAARKLAEGFDALDEFAMKVGVVGKGVTKDQYAHAATPEEQARREHLNAQTPATAGDAAARNVLHNTGETFRQAENTSGEIVGKGAEVATRQGVPVLAAAAIGRIGQLAGESLEGASSATSRGTGISRLDRLGFVEFQGLEVRGARDLSHVPEGTLRAMEQRGFAATDAQGNRLILHHLEQNPAGPLVEMPAGRHSIGNPRQHPLGNAPGVGLSAEQRAAFNQWRVDYWKARAAEELARRGGQ